MSGKCIVCGVEGRGRKDFLCENCANPEKIIWVCAKCGRKRELTPEELEIICVCFLGKTPNQKGGVIVRVSCCKDCQPEGKPEAIVYTMKKEDLLSFN
jgi:hypothetical protein